MTDSDASAASDAENRSRNLASLAALCGTARVQEADGEAAVGGVRAFAETVGQCSHLNRKAAVEPHFPPVTTSHEASI